MILAVVVLGISLLRGAFAYGQSYLSDYISQSVALDLRRAFLSRLQALSFGFHDRQKTGDLMSRATADVQSVRWFVNFGLIYSLHILVLVGGAASLMLITDWDLALVGMAAMPITVYMAVRVRRRFRQLWTGVQVETGRMTTILQENLSGMQVVKTFGAEEYEEEKFRESARVVSEDTFTVNRLHAANTSFFNMLFSLATVGVIWYGGWQIVNADVTLGELTRFILYLGLLTFPVRMAGWVVNSFARAVSAGERIFEVLDARSAWEGKEGDVSLGRVTGRVRFEEVAFTYAQPTLTATAPLGEETVPHPMGRNGGDAPQDLATPEQGQALSPLPQGERKLHLRNINLDVQPGQRIAMLGAPGSGKSTMISLIPRFYDVAQGRVTIDGTDVRNVTVESLRRNVGVVFQDVFLFMASMRENIAYGAPDASLQEIEAAARAAQIHDFIMGLPEQYDTLVGERGVTLSGGQRQRVAIARTLLLDPPILILDDSTSSVDAETEALIRKALDEVMEGRTTFIIAHRVSSVRSADLILVLKDGEIVERGTHEELIAGDGLYRGIYELQLLPREEALMETVTGAGDGEEC